MAQETESPVDKSSIVRGDEIRPGESAIDSLITDPTGNFNVSATTTTQSGLTSLKNIGTTPCADGSVLISETTYTAKDGYNYKDTPVINMLNLKHGSYDYSNHYNTKIIPTYTNNRISSFVAQVFYSPPQEAPLFPDPNNIIDFNHIAFIDFELQQTSEKITNTITHISYNNILTRLSQEVLVTVYGTVGAQYKIELTKQSSITSDVVASNGYYNFNTNLFGSNTSDTSLDGTIGSDGKTIHAVSLPSVDLTTRYDIILNPNGSILGSNVPTKHGDASITQYGFNTLTFRPTTHTTNKFNDMPSALSIKKPARAEGLEWGGQDAVPIHILAGNGNTSTTDLVLEKENDKIKTGMLVTGLGATNTTSSHNITVSNVFRDLVTLSSAFAVADNTTVRFDKNLASIIPFDFMVLPFSGKDLFLIRQPQDNDVGGFDTVATVSHKSSGRALVLKRDDTYEGTDGVVPGMKVEGTGVPEGTTVTTISSDRSLVLDKEISVPADTQISFSTDNTNIEVIDIQAYKADGGIKVRGLLEVNEINTTAIASIYVDNFIKIV